jgi:hypothetical protein
MPTKQTRKVAVVLDQWLTRLNTGVSPHAPFTPVVLMQRSVTEVSGFSVTQSTDLSGVVSEAQWTEKVFPIDVI